MNEHYFLLEDSLNSLQHALLLNKVKLFLNQLGKARNCLVQILVPDIVEAQYALSYLLGIAGSPKLFWSSFGWIGAPSSRTPPL